jgi:hypothetical protein
MVIVTLQQIIDERKSFLKEQINHENKPEVNSTFQLQIDAIRSVDDLEKVDPIILERKAQLKNSTDVHESDMLFAQLDGLEWLQAQIVVFTLVKAKEGGNTKGMTPTNHNTTFPTTNKSPSYLSRLCVLVLVQMNHKAR